MSQPLAEVDHVGFEDPIVSFPMGVGDGVMAFTDLSKVKTFKDLLVPLE